MRTRNRVKTRTKSCLKQGDIVKVEVKEVLNVKLVEEKQVASSPVDEEVTGVN